MRHNFTPPLSPTSLFHTSPVPHLPCSTPPRSTPRSPRCVYYCSVHCQGTHFRDGHRSECKRLGEELKAQERRDLEEAEAVKAELRQQAEEDKKTAAAVAAAAKAGSEVATPTSPSAGTPAASVSKANPTSPSGGTPAAASRSGDLTQPPASSVSSGSEGAPPATFRQSEGTLVNGKATTTTTTNAAMGAAAAAAAASLDGGGPAGCGNGMGGRPTEAESGSGGGEVAVDLYSLD